MVAGVTLPIRWDSTASTGFPGISRGMKKVTVTARIAVTM